MPNPFTNSSWTKSRSKIPWCGAEDVDDFDEVGFPGAVGSNQNIELIELDRLRVWAKREQVSGRDLAQKRFRHDYFTSTVTRGRWPSRPSRRPVTCGLMSSMSRW